MQRRHFLALVGSLAATSAAEQAFATPPGFVEPVHRVANATSLAPAPSVKIAPLDDALQRARHSLALCQSNIQDYTALLVKRERIGATLGPHEFMTAKIRCRKVREGRIVQPLSVYLSFV